MPMQPPSANASACTGEGPAWPALSSTIVASAERAQEDPHRITAVAIDFTVTGNVPKEQVQRAIDLSHDKYCSVWHSMRQDIPFTTTFSVGKVG